jgi:hypothetical protein
MSWEMGKGQKKLEIQSLSHVRQIDVNKIMLWSKRKCRLSLGDYCLEPYWEHVEW